MTDLKGGRAIEEHLEDKVCKPKKHPDGTDVGYIVKFCRTSTQAERDSHLAEVEKLNQPYLRYFEGLCERLEPDEFSTESDDFYAYYGCFHPLVMDFIKQQIVVVGVEEDNWAVTGDTDEEESVVEDEDGITTQKSPNRSASRVNKLATLSQSEIAARF